MYPVVLPCKPGSDCWYVDAETFEVCYEKGGITGFVVLLPGESCGQRSLEGCSPWGHKESDTTD